MRVVYIIGTISTHSLLIIGVRSSSTFVDTQLHYHCCYLLNHVIIHAIYILSLPPSKHSRQLHYHCCYLLNHVITHAIYILSLPPLAQNFLFLWNVVHCMLHYTRVFIFTSLRSIGEQHTVLHWDVNSPLHHIHLQPAFCTHKWMHLFTLHTNLISVSPPSCITNPPSLWRILLMNIWSAGLKEKIINRLIKIVNYMCRHTGNIDVSSITTYSSWQQTCSHTNMLMLQ